MKKLTDNEKLLIKNGNDLKLLKMAACIILMNVTDNWLVVLWAFISIISVIDFIIFNVKHWNGW